MIKGLHIVIAILISNWVMAQQSITFSLVAEKNKVEIGDPLTMSMRVTYPAHIAPGSIQFPVLEAGISLTDTLDILSVSETKNSTSTDNQGNPTLTWQQDFSMGIYAGGNIEVGPFEVIMGIDTILSNVATITVSTPELQEDAEFVGIKGIEQDPYTFWEKLWMWLKTYWLWILIPLLLLVGAFVLIRYLNKKPEEKLAPVPQLPLPIQLLQKLETVEAAQLWQQGKHKEYYTDVTDVIRRFLEYKYQIPALEKTSDEILQSLSLSAINKNDYNQLRNLFSLANMIKFAKSMPVAEENIQAMTIAKGLINKEIKKTQ